MNIIKHNNSYLEKIINKRKIVIDDLKKRGYKITKKRLLIIDIILNNRCACCKEIYWEAVQRDPSIGIATVYRMMKILEEIGAIAQNNLYEITCEYIDCMNEECVVVLKNKETIHLSAETWARVIESGLYKEKIIKDGELETVLLRKCNNMIGVDER